jgi:hypothetical protein
MDPIASIQLAQEGGSGSIAGVTEASVNLTRGIIDLPQMGSTAPLDLQSGQFVASGSFSCYFPDSSMSRAHLTRDLLALVHLRGQLESPKYNFLFSRVKLTIPDVPNGGVNNTFVHRVEWKAFKDATDAACKITRTP